jgi:hypothetical protein
VGEAAPAAPRYPWPAGLYAGTVSPDGRYLIQLGVLDLRGTVTPLPARDLGFDAGQQSDTTVFIGTATDATRGVAF